jgi:hypothetical protein
MQPEATPVGGDQGPPPNAMTLGSARTYPPYGRLVTADLLEPWPCMTGTLSYMRRALGVDQTIGRP